MADVFDDPQAKARGLALSLPHATLGAAPSVRSPIRYSRSSTTAEMGPPALGQHSREILAGLLGLDDSEIEALAADGVIGLQGR